jgi:hypothetical protein
VKFDLTTLLSPPTQAQSPPNVVAATVPERGENPKPSDTTTVRVFLTGAKASTVKENALKAFHDRCPQAQITMEKEKASYVVELVPSGLRQSKNEVLVTNQAGDVIHTGATLNLGNAAKDACAAILKDLKEKS